MTEDIKKIIEDDNVKIITDVDFLKQPCEKVDSIEEGEEIANKLFRVLNKHKNGIGLSANQIGIQKNVAVVNVKTPIYMINPRIVENTGEMFYIESCLSFPEKFIRTKRYSSIMVEADNFDGKLYSDVSTIWEKDVEMENLDVLECVAVQHELSHLKGKTMFDYECKIEPIKSNKKYSRNDKITISNDIDTLKIKYKKYEQFKSKGYKIVEK